MNTATQTSTTALSASTDSGPGFWDRYVRPSDPDRPNPVWHISPVLDAAAYHFSWVWVLIPMLFTGPDQFKDYLYLYAFVLGVNLAHRHFGFPYAYLDEGVFRTYRRQLTWFPLFCIALLAVTPVLLDRKIMGPTGRQIVDAIVFFSLLWTFWHTYMQKFGILRLYMAKDPAPLERKTPGWVDKYFIFCWFPLYFAYLGPTYKNLIFRNGGAVLRYTSVIIRFMEENQFWLVGPSVAIAAGGVGVWIWHDWRAHRLKNPARLSAAAGMLLVSTALFWTDPVKAYIAFAFSHAIEYMVFVWAFQRRRYHRPQAVPSLMQKLLSRPVLWYTVFIVLFAAAAILETLWGRSILKGMKNIVFFGMTGRNWFFYYAVYESLVHFYMDGFLWKMRKAEVRDNI